MDSEFVHVCTKYTVYSMYDQVCTHLMLFPWHSGIISFRKAKRTRTYTSMLRFKKLILRTKFVREKKHRIYQNPDHSFRFTLSPFTNLKTWFGKGFSFFAKTPPLPKLEIISCWNSTNEPAEQPTWLPALECLNLLPKCCRGATQTWRFNGPCIDKSHIPCRFSTIIQYVWIIYANGIMITFKNQEHIPKKNCIYI